MKTIDANVWFVDDDPAIHRRIGRISGNPSHGRLSARCGGATLETVQAAAPDVFLPDGSMPDKDDISGRR
jgi:DNA-binding response OmpR family regulator